MSRAARSAEGRAFAAIEKHGALLVYPLANRARPRSLWSALHPRTPMRWAWDETADDRVVALWHLREKIARSRKAPYAKWYRGRAVFFSKPAFGDLLTALAPWAFPVSAEAREILAILEETSPLSTKVVRREAGLRGKQGERVWQRSLNELWRRLAIVGTGEVDDGAFPSLQIGATRLVFEEAWDTASRGDSSDASARVEARFADEPAFLRYFREITVQADE